MPVVVLACVVPFLVEIERVELTPGDELVVAALRATALRATALHGGDDHVWYRALPPQLRAQLTQIEFLDLLGRLREAGIVTTSPAGANQLTGSLGKLRLRLPWR